MTGQEELLELAALARRSLEPGLPRNASGHPSSEGACLYAALIVVALLRRFGRGQAVVRGGRPKGAGALDVQGIWRGHYWVEVMTLDGEVFIVDVTADQFGFAPVVVLPRCQAESRYVPGPQDEVDEAFADLVQEFGCSDLVAA